MNVRCIWEHNGEDTLLYVENCIGAFTRGESLDSALRKMKKEIQSYSAWLGETVQEDIVPVIVQEKNSDLEIKDADSDVLFLSEEEPLTMEEYERLRELTLKSATDFLSNLLQEGSYGEMWSVRKVLRRFIWHDRIHAKAMWRMAKKTFEKDEIENVFHFE